MPPPKLALKNKHKKANISRVLKELAVGEIGFGLMDEYSATALIAVSLKRF